MNLQGTPEWHADRLGKCTASRFDDVLKKARDKKVREAGGLGKTAESYLLDIVAETITGQSQDPPPNKAEQWGTDNEPGARIVYEQLTGLKVREVGFMPHATNAMIGGSPDGLVGLHGGIEIKCPYNTRIHLGYLLGGMLPKEHEAQVQGLMGVTDREWWDFVSYDPRIKDVRLALWRLRVERDDDYLRALWIAVDAFIDKLVDTLCTLKKGE